MLEFEMSVLINRPLEEVFAFLARTENETQWQAGLIESRRTSEGPVGVGATGRDTRKFMGRDIVTTWEVTGFEPNKRFAFKVISGPIPFTGTYAFTESGSGTNVTITAEAKTTGLTQLFEPLIARMSRKQYEGDFATLKTLLESQG